MSAKKIQEVLNLAKVKVAEASNEAERDIALDAIALLLSLLGKKGSPPKQSNPSLRSEIKLLVKNYFY